MQSIVKKVWIVDNPSVSEPRLTQPMVFDGSLEIILAQRAGFSLVFDDIRLNYGPGIFLGGQISKRMSLELKPGARLCFLKIDPWTLGPSSVLSLHEVQNRCLELSALAPTLNRQLVRLHPNASTARIKRTIERWQEDERHHSAKADLARYAGERLRAQNDNPQTNKRGLLQDLGISSRTLETTFAEMIGISPTQFATLHRLRKITEQLLYQGMPDSLTRLALDHGFFDQAHFSRAMKTFCGSRPSALSGQILFVPNSQEDFRVFTI